jgi:hypothetical protein
MTVGCRSPQPHSMAWPSEFGRSIQSPLRDYVSSAMTVSPVVFNNGPLVTESNRHVADHREKDGQGADGN